MKHYKVLVVRTAYSSIYFAVEAECEEDAMLKAHQEALNTAFLENASDYEVCKPQEITD